MNYCRFSRLMSPSAGHHGPPAVRWSRSRSRSRSAVRYPWSVTTTRWNLSRLGDCLETAGSVIGKIRRLGGSNPALEGGIEHEAEASPFPGRTPPAVALAEIWPNLPPRWPLGRNLPNLPESCWIPTDVPRGSRTSALGDHHWPLESTMHGTALSAPHGSLQINDISLNNRW